MRDQGIRGETTTINSATVNNNRDTCNTTKNTSNMNGNSAMGQQESAGLSLDAYQVAQEVAVKK